MLYDDEINILERNISFTHGDQITNYDSGYICDVFSEIASNNIDIYYYDLFNWAKDNTYYVDESMREYGNCNDIVKQIQMVEGYAFEQELYDNFENILQFYTYTYLRNNDIDLSEEKITELEEYIKTIDNNSRLEDINYYCDDLGRNDDIEVW